MNKESTKVRKFQADLDIEITYINREVEGERNRIDNEVKDLENKISRLCVARDSLIEKKINRTKLVEAEYEKNVAQWES